MYYALILLSVVMFGGCFALNDSYRKIRGSSIKISLQFSLVSSIAGFLVLLIMNGFKIEFSPFTLAIAAIAALSGFGFTFCGFKALGRINLSLYSLFSMLGGMVLPFLQGIIFYNEDFTVAKAVCLAFICLALLITVERKGGGKGGVIYYIGIFVLNGLSGVLSKIFEASSYEKTSARGYSILICLCSIALSAIILLAMRKTETSRSTPASLGISAASGVTNKVANLFLVIALAHVDASVQYPMVTGGVMIVSTAICFFGKKKPSTKELISVSLAFLGMLALFIIPV